LKADEAQTKLIELPQAQVKIAQKEELGRDIIYLKSSPGRFRKIGRYLYQSLGFWLFQILSLIIFLGILIFNLRQQRLITDRRYARRLQAPAKAKRGIQESDKIIAGGKIKNSLMRHLRLSGISGNRFHLPSGHNRNYY
jgi:hypothetical protein